MLKWDVEMRRHGFHIEWVGSKCWGNVMGSWKCGLAGNMEFVACGIRTNNIFNRTSELRRHSWVHDMEPFL